MKRTCSPVRPFLLFFLTALSISVSVPGWAAKDAEALYQDAMIKETGERDLEAAIGLYQQAIEQEGSSNSLLVSKSRYRMANCYERLGKTAEAGLLYQQIVTDAANTPGEISQLAQDSLKRLDTEQKMQLAAATTEYVHVYKETPASLTIGPAFISTSEGLRTQLSIALRYRLMATTPARPQRVFLELGAIPPTGSLKIQDRTKTPDSQTTDVGTLDLHYQFHVALIVELPHGDQKTCIPEIGAGMALTRSEINYTSVVTGATPSTYSGSQSESNWGPYLHAGLHFYPEHIISFLLQGNYTAIPYSRSVTIPVPPHTETFSFTNSLWGITAQVQVKVGWTKVVKKTK